jgi:hypothetical protein
MLYEDIVPKLYTHVPLAPHPALMDAIQAACVDFCKQTTIYRYTTTFDSVVGTHFYDAGAPAGTVPCEIITGRFNGYPLEPSSSILVNRMHTLGSPKYYRLHGAQIRVDGAAPVALVGGFEFEIAVTPSYSSVQIADTVFEEYWEAIIDGALARLYALPGKAWSSPRDADYRQGRFNAAVADATSRSNADNTGKLRVCSYGG